MAAPMRAVACGRITARNLPIVVVLGATGAGKSKLAIELACRFNGEIISADSMQVYKGLDIVTNKVTTEERQQVPHHLIDYVSPLKSDYTVWDFRNTALPIIDKLWQKQKLPIIVGGTNYYIEALLWKLLIDKKDVNADETEDAGTDDADPSQSAQNVKKSDRTDIAPDVYVGNSAAIDTQQSSSTGSHDKVINTKPDKTNTDLIDIDMEVDLNTLSTAVLFKRLEAVDVKSARRLHPNDRRKILRALEVYKQHGQLMSDILQSQHQEDGASHVSGPLRFPHPCVIWVHSDQSVLDDRTDRRVDTMIQDGLLEELKAFHAEYNQSRLSQEKEADYELGIFQSIGFKEFHPYLLQTSEQQDEEAGKKMLQECVSQMKRVTRRYARRQVKWIVGRFLKRRGQNVPPVYQVDSSRAENWHQEVYTPAAAVVEAYLQGETPAQEPLPVTDNPNEPLHNVCQVCDLVFVTKKDWEAHIKGRRHKKAIERMHRQQRLKMREQEADSTPL